MDYKKGDHVTILKTVSFVNKSLRGRSGIIHDPEPFIHEPLVEVAIDGDTQKLFYFWKKELEGNDEPVLPLGHFHKDVEVES